MENLKSRVWLPWVSSNPTPWTWSPDTADITAIINKQKYTLSYWLLVSQSKIIQFWYRTVKISDFK